MQKKLFVGLIKSRRGIIGVSILGFLLSLTVIAVLVIPFDSYRLWNDPDYWINNPKTAAPSWTNYFGSKEFEHVSLDKNNAKTSSEVSEGIRVDNFRFEINVQADDFPDDFMFLHSLKYGEIPPVLQIDITRPDNNTFTVYYSSLPTTNSQNNTFTDRIFSTNNNIKESLSQYQNIFSFPISGFEPQVLLFSDTTKPQVLHGTYHISQRFFLFDNSSSIEDVGIILGGKVFGIMGTDDLRRDLFVGIIWGIPIALFIGLTVSIFAISIGLVYGVVSGYRAKKTDEVMMRINDIFYAFPTLILLILLSITFGRSIILIILLLMVFGWMGTAKVIRSIALQMRNFQYVEAAKLMGQSDMKVIFKHIVPQLLPLTFASVAISVPGAILAEAALSFIGLGDPTLPTWGQLLHDANTADAASRGIWWWIIPPGLMIALTGLAFFLIGNSLDAVANPLRKQNKKV
ncbi:MAG TPA: ABC transporter permease [Nitrososphaeraceae archaeon]|nr:ABC transporter permease [Nitrososphaeraceae archaeon]